MPPPRVGTLAAAAVLLGAALLGIARPAARLAAGAPPPFTDLPARADQAFAPLRATLAPGERIGLLLASGDPNADGAYHYTAQYALAPALVEAIYLEDCLAPALGPRCRLDRVPRVALMAWDAGLVDYLGRRFGLAPAGQQGPILVLAARRR